jgi:hypothetical protein
VESSHQKVDGVQQILGDTDRTCEEIGSDAVMFLLQDLELVVRKFACDNLIEGLRVTVNAGVREVIHGDYPCMLSFVLSIECNSAAPENVPSGSAPTTPLVAANMAMIYLHCNATSISDQKTANNDIAARGS